MYAMSISPDKRHQNFTRVHRIRKRCFQKKEIASRYVARTIEWLLEDFVNETDLSVKRTIADIIFAVVSHKSTKTKWPKMDTIIYNMYNKSLNEREHALSLLMIMVDKSNTMFDGCINKIVKLLEASINTFSYVSEDPNNTLPYIAVIIYKCLYSKDKENIDHIIFQSILENFPIMLQVIRRLSTTDTSQCMRGIELLNVLSISGISTRYLCEILDLLVELTLNERMEENLRVKAICILSRMVDLKKSCIAFCGKLKPIVHLIFLILSCKPDGNNEFIDTEEETTTVMSTAINILNNLWLHIPPSRLVQILMAEVKGALDAESINGHIFSYLLMAMICFNYKEGIKASDFEEYMDIVCQGLAEDTPTKYAAFVALGAFTECFELAVSKRADSVVPHIGSALDAVLVHLKTSNEDTKPMEKFLYTTGLFLMSLTNHKCVVSTALEPFFKDIINKVFEILATPSPVVLHYLALELLGAIVASAGDIVLPFLGKIIQKLGEYLGNSYTADTMLLPIGVLASLRLIWHHVKKEHTRPMLQDIIELAAGVIQREKDELQWEPQVHLALYGLIAELSIAHGSEIQPYLPVFMGLILSALQSTRGLIFNLRDVGQEASTSKAYKNKAIFLAEKKDACAAIKDIAENVGISFMIYLEDCFLEVYKLLLSPEKTLSMAAVDTLVALLTYKFKCATTFDAECHKDTAVSINALYSMVCYNMEHAVVLAALEGLDFIIRAILPVYEPLMDPQETMNLKPYIHVISELIYKVLNGDILAFKQDRNADSQSESKSKISIQENAWALLPLLGSASPGMPFFELLCHFMPMIFNKMEKNSIKQTAYYLSILVDCTSSLCADVNTVRTVFSTLLYYFTIYIKNPTSRLRGISLYGLGELCYYSRIVYHKSDTLQVLSLIMQALFNEKVPDVIDIAVASLARLILAGPQNLPLHVLMPAMVKELPLKIVTRENHAVFMCLQRVYDLDLHSIKKLLPDIVRVAALTLHRNQTHGMGTQRLICQLMACIQHDCPSVWSASLSGLPLEEKTSLLGISSLFN